MAAEVRFPLGFVGVAVCVGLQEGWGVDKGKNCDLSFF
jgi:hypothetical protein